MFPALSHNAMKHDTQYMQAPIMQPQFTIQLTMIIMTQCKIEFTYASTVLAKMMYDAQKVLF